MKNIVMLGGAHIHAPGFINRLSGHETVRLSHVWDPDPACAARRAEQSGAMAIGTIEEALSLPCDGYVVCSETSRHSEIVPLAAPKRKPLFVEKPLGMGAIDASDMADLIDAAGCPFSTGYFMRGDPKIRQVRQWVESGVLGKITRVRASNCHSGAIGGWFDSEWRWMADLSQAGVGAFGDLGTHVLDILVWIFGPVEAVSAVLDNGTARYPNCDETGEALMKFESGVIGTLAAAWDDVEDPVRLLVSGTKGHAAIIHGDLVIKCEEVAGGDGRTPFTDLVPASVAGFDGFLDHVAGGKTGELVAVREAAYRNRVMEAIYSSASTGAWKKV